MDQREARKYTSTNPPTDYHYERRPSFLDRLLARRRTSSTSSDDMNMAASLQRRGSIEQPELNGSSITQRVQQEMPKPVAAPAATAPAQTTKRYNSPEFSIFT